ncbi:MAG: DUF3558 family protein, partial [Acidimicrobiia bacterium]
MSSMPRASWFALALALVVGVAACGSSSGSKSSGPASSPSSSSPSDSSSKGGADKKIDACTLLSDAEAESMLGEPLTNTGPGAGVGQSVCEWDTESSYSVTISVGTPGTAPDDKLTLDPVLGTPQPVASLNGKGSYVGSGTVYFTAGTRLNSVQVVTAAFG